MENVCMHKGKVTGDCTPVPFAENVWTQTAMHVVGNGSAPLTVTNRTAIYELKNQEGAPYLVLLNALWVDGPEGDPIDAIKAFAEERGAPVRFILTPDSSHHLNLRHYATAFPDARVCVPAGRIERENPELCALPNVEVYPPDAPPPELLQAGLRIFAWKGLVEGPLARRLARSDMNFSYEPGSIQTQVFLHEPSGTITNGGHHMWYRGEQEVFQANWFVRQMMRWMMGFDLTYQKPRTLNLEPNGGVKVVDREAVSACAKEILSWKFDRMLDMHVAPDEMLQSGAYEVWKTALTPVVEGDWDSVPWLH